MRLIEAKDIENWADTRADAVHRLPELVRRLIHATTSDLRRRNMTSGKGVYASGFDGIVERDPASTIGHAFVPPGFSIWELGTSEDPERKANEDYRKRTQDPLGVNPATTRFVFVTPRIWRGRTAWEAAKQKLGQWADVRVIDADVLEQWLETAPSAEGWLAELLGKPTRLMQLESFWKEWSPQTKPPLDSAIVLAGRDVAEAALWQWLRRPPSALPVAVDDPAEAAAFLHAVLKTQPDDERRGILDRAAVVNDEETLRRLGDEKHGLVIVTQGCAIERARVVAAKGHHVVCAVLRDGARTEEQIELGPLDRAKVSALLERLGVPAERAQRLSRASYGRLATLRRLLRAPRRTLPSELAPLLLVGGWNSGHAPDVAIVATIANRSPAELETIVRTFTASGDEPLRQFRDEVRWLSREDAWISLGQHLTDMDIRRFTDAMLECLPTEERLYDSDASGQLVARGAPRQHSEVLRQGLAETLVLLAMSEERNNAQHLVDDMVGQLLAKLTTPLLWESNFMLLGTLAEASPEAFITRIKALLDAERDVAKSLFGGVGPGGKRRLRGIVNFLWAISVLAWVPDHLAEVCAILARIGELEPKDLREGPTARDLLAEIFLPWGQPSTSASLTERNTVLTGLVERHPVVGYELVLTLLDKTTPHPSPKPRHRPWVDSCDTRNDEQDGREARAVLWDLAVDGPRKDPARWPALIEHLDHLSRDPHRPQAVAMLASIDPTQLDAATLKSLRAALRSVVDRHRQSSDRPWAMSPELLEMLVNTQRRLEPRAPLEQAAQMFARSPIILDIAEGPDRYEHIRMKRREAIDDIVRLLDAEALFQFATGPGIEDRIPLGWLLSEAPARDELVRRLVVRSLRSSDDAAAELRHGLVRGIEVRAPGTWLEVLRLAALPLADRVTVALSLAHFATTWAAVEVWGDEAVELFWKQVPWVELPPDGDAQVAIRHMARVGRQRAALEFAASLATSSSTWLSPSLALEALRLAENAPPNESEGPALGAYGVAKLLDAVASGGEVDAPTMRNLELAWYAEVNHHMRTPEAVYDALASDPAFFVELCERSLRGEDNQASSAWQILREWTAMPGLRGGVEVDSEALCAWVRKARACLETLGPEIRKVGEQNIGWILARSPRGADGDWPHEAVRDLLERVEHPEHIENGFVSGHFHRSGAFFFNPLAGGNGDRASADAHRRAAERMRARWPATARQLRAIAKRYQQNAQASDMDANSIADQYGHVPHAEERLEVFVDDLQAAGRYSFALAEFIETSEYSERTVRDAARALADRDRVSPVDEDFFAIVPLEHRARKGLPPSWYIDSWMKHAQSSYYVGLLAAAAIHGASHQQAQTFHVMVDKPRPAVTIGVAKIAFIECGMANRATQEVKTETGTMQVSTPETTMLDLIAFVDRVGGMDIVASVIFELAERVQGDRIAKLAPHYPTEVVQRLGWLLEDLGLNLLADGLLPTLPGTAGAVPFEEDAIEEPGSVSNRWRVFGTRQIEIES